MRGYRIDPRDRKDLTLARYIYNVEIYGGPVCQDSKTGAKS